MELVGGLGLWRRDGWKARRCFLLLAVLPGSEWLGHGGVFIVWEAGSQVAQLGEAGARAWRWRSGSVGRGEGHGVTSGLSLHGAATVGPGVPSGGGQPPGKVGAAWTATSERPLMRPCPCRLRWLEHAVVSRPMQISLQLGRGFWRMQSRDTLAD